MRRSGKKVIFAVLGLTFFIWVRGSHGFPNSLSGWMQDMIWHMTGFTGESVSFSPDGKLLATTMGFGEIGLFRVSDGSLIRALEGHAGDVYSVSFSPDGKMIAGTTGFGEIELFSVSDGSLIRTPVGHAGPVLSVSFSPDGSMIASGGDDGLALWRVGAGIITSAYVDVWPGDTNNDGIVDEREILVIGMNWMKRRAGTPSLSPPLVHLEHKPSAKEIEAYRRMYCVLNDSGMKGEGIERLKGALLLLISQGEGLTKTSIGRIYPNPFRSPVHIPYVISSPSHVSLKVYNVYGQLVGTIFEGDREAGVYEAVWDGEGLCEGVYLFVLKAGGKTYCAKGVRMR